MTPRPKKRRSRPYDSARTAPRSTGQRSVSRPSGYQEQELTFENTACALAKYHPFRAYDFESQRPQQGNVPLPGLWFAEPTSAAGERPAPGPMISRVSVRSRARPVPGRTNSIQFPTQQVRRPAGGSNQNKTVHTGQRLRPGSGPAAAPQAPADDPGRDAPPPVGTPTDGLWAFALRQLERGSI